MMSITGRDREICRYRHESEIIAGDRRQNFDVQKSREADRNLSAKDMADDGFAAGVWIWQQAHYGDEGG